MSGPPPPPRPGGLSLYANLIDDPSTKTVSSAPVLYNSNDSSQAAGAAASKKTNPSLQFQPIRRPQAKTNKPAPKPGIFPKSAGAAPQPPKPAAGAGAGPATDNVPVVAVKTTLADWANTEDDEYLYSRGNNNKRRRKKRGGNAGGKAAQTQTDWNEIYDPTRPTNVEEYLASDERIWEIREWREVLYRRRRRERGSDRSDDEDEDQERRPMANQFAPPASYAAVPPPPQSPPPPATIPDDATGDDAYARRLAMSQGITHPPPPPPQDPSPPPPIADADAGYSATISRAPVRYTQPESPSPPSSPRAGLGSAPEDDDTARSTMPGQAGFAQRLMGKYGWTKGSGLGADGSGIINPLQVKVEKRKRRPDSEGGGWAEPTAKAKIFGGKKKPTEGDEGYGSMSEVVVLRDMLEGMEDLEGEISGGLSQEIGEECGEKYGRVERLRIDVETRQVFIKFTDAVSALRAVGELNGRVFNGNTIVARFYDAEKFDKGILR